MLCALLLGLASASACAENWLPIAPEELKMTGDPKAPGAPAIFLYRQVDRDDNGPSETDYVRIKILTDEGRKYGNVEIPFVRGNEWIRGIEARTVRPDGSVVAFDGMVYEKTLYSARGSQYLAKTFSMPAVEVGSIVEYRYHDDMAQGYVFNSHWILSQDLFTQHAKFSLQPSRDFTLIWSWPAGLPAGADTPKQEYGRVHMEVHNVPAFVNEDYMPPENELKYRVDFVYDTDAFVEKDPAKFWKRSGKKLYGDVESFVDKRREMEQAVAGIVQPGDSPDTKLHKIYARCQQLRNTSFEREKSEQELKHDNEKDARNVDEVWKRGYGNGVQITWLFLGLARAAGIDAQAIMIPTRDNYFFNLNSMNPGQLNSNAVLIKLNGKYLYFDPGTPYTPYGVLPWNETAVYALRLDKDGGDWITTPVLDAAGSRVERKAALKLDRGGTLQGKLTVSYSGLEAQWRRLAQRDEDETARKAFLEDEVKEDVPTGIDVALINQPDWAGSDAALTAEFELTVPGWAAAAGQRELLGLGLFSGSERGMFSHAARVQPICFHFPYQHVDDVTIELPEGLQVSSIPQPRSTDIKVLAYSVAAQSDNASLHLTRSLALNTLLLQPKDYPWLHDFFQNVRADDAQQLVLSPLAPPGRH